MDCYARPLGWLCGCPLTRMVGWPCFALGLCCVVCLGLALGLLYTRETQTGGRIYPSIGDWIMPSLPLPCCFVRCACVRGCWSTLSCLLLCVLFCPSIHPSSAIHCIRNPYCVGGRSHHLTSTSTNPPSWTGWMLLFTVRWRERASEQAVLTRCYTQQRSRFPLNPQNATVPRYDTM